MVSYIVNKEGKFVIEYIKKASFNVSHTVVNKEDKFQCQSCSR